MDLRADATLPCPPARARRELEVLDHYPEWLGIVLAVRPADRDPADPGPAWWVDLGARLGPLRRGKRVRMARVVAGPTHVRFERRELDDVDHPPWVLDVVLAAQGREPPATFATLTLHYGGAAWVPLLDAVLAAEVQRGGRRLAARVAALRSGD